MKFYISHVTWFKIVELILTLIILAFLIVKLFVFRDTIDLGMAYSMFS